MVNVEEFQTAFTLGKAAIEAARSAWDLLPNSAKSRAAKQQLEKAAKAMAIAEAEAAKGLGYEICRDHWPPEIMLYDARQGTHTCGSCGIKLHRPRPGVIDPGVNP